MARPLLLSALLAPALASLGAVTDVHLHLSNFSLFTYTWANASAGACPCAPPCACDWTLADYAAANLNAPASKLVFVEVAVAPAQWLLEAQWVEGLIAGGGAAAAIGAIVAQRPPGFGVVGADFAQLQSDVASLAALPHVVGVRAGAIDYTNASAVAALAPHFALLAAHRFSMDVVQPVTAAVAAGLAGVAAAQPGLTIVLDHLGGAPVLANASAIADWAQGMATLGALPNVFVKVGGLFQHYKDAQAIPSVATVQPFVAAGLAAFPGRAAFERNWLCV